MTRPQRYIAMAKLIEDEEFDFISPGYSDSPLTMDDFDALERWLGEKVYFDDPTGFYPNKETRGQRVTLLCFAAAALDARSDSGIKDHRD